MKDADCMCIIMMQHETQHPIFFQAGPHLGHFFKIFKLGGIYLYMIRDFVLFFTLKAILFI